MYIVLPPDLSWRAISILVQYIYTGEATVSTDILNEVLRGGELLKIRGLWRNQPNNEHNNVTPAIEKSVIEHSSKQKEIRESIIYDRLNLQPSNEDNLAIIPKDSPVIVMPSTHIQQKPPSSSTTSESIQPIQPNHPTLIVKKDVAIDPGDVNNIPSTHYGLVSLQIAAAVKKAQETEKQQHKSSEYVSENLNFNDDYSGTSRLKEVHSYESGMPLHATCKIKNVEPLLQPNVQIEETLNFLTIKQEPIDWMEFDQKSNNETKHHSEIPVKPEIIHTDAEEDSCSNHGPIYSLLTCELCSATFTVPGEWVRHIENHPETTNVLPKRRRRIDVSISYMIEIKYLVNFEEWFLIFISISIIG